VWQIFAGSLVLSVLHAMIPSHWIPMIAIGKAEKWSTREILFVTGIAGFAHTLSTVMIGIFIGFVGYKLAGNFEFITSLIAPSVLVLIGAVYIILDFAKSKHGHDHILVDSKNTGKSKWTILISLSLAMFFSPCLELEAYYFQAGTMGWQGILTVSAVYIFVTVMIMMLLVFLGSRGIQKINSHFIEHHEKALSGIVLIILGILAFLVRH
jgi:nickel/cobalt exporter